MAKHDRRKTSGQPPSSRPVTIQVPLPVLGVVNGVREAFHGFCIATGLQVLEAMMEADREVLCGAKGRHQVERPAWRGGSVDSQVTLGGRQVELPRLRVRSSDGEVPLASFQWAAATDPLDEHTLAAVAAGVSTRRYAGTLDPVPADVTERATSSSAVSRRFVALSTKRLQAFLSRPLGELDLRAVCIDGKVFRDHCMVIALGIDTQGRKHVLGLREGATETAAVTTGLLSDLVTRGLPTQRRASALGARRMHAGRSLPRGAGGVNTRAAGRGTTTAGIAATTDAVTTVAAAGERGRQGTRRGVIYQPGYTLTKSATFPENRTTSVSRLLTGSSTVPFHRGGRCFVRLPVSRSLTGSSTVPVHREGGSRQRMSGPSTMSHPALWTCPACGRPLTVALNPEGGEAGAHRPLEISRASAAAHACTPAARFPQFHSASSSSSITGYEPASCQPWQPPVSAGAEDDEGVISQSEYTLTKPSSCPNHRDHVSPPSSSRTSRNGGEAVTEPELSA